MTKEDYMQLSKERLADIDIDKMVGEFAHTEVKGYGIPSLIEVDAYRKGINDAVNLIFGIAKQA